MNMLLLNNSNWRYLVPTTKKPQLYFDVWTGYSKKAGTRNTIFAKNRSSIFVGDDETHISIVKVKNIFLDIDSN
jgi:hypothetical protein